MYVNNGFFYFMIKYYVFRYFNFVNNFYDKIVNEEIWGKQVVNIKEVLIVIFFINFIV